MSTVQIALDFVESKGRSLAGINPGSNEYALGVDDAIQAGRLFQQAGISISGGDVLSEAEGKLIYAYQLWGDGYIYLNWYCRQENNETNEAYCRRSFEAARAAILLASREAGLLNRPCYIVLVTHVGGMR